MQVTSHRQFQKSVSRIPRAIEKKVAQFYCAVEASIVFKDVLSMPQVKTIKGYPTYFRARFGKYRLGFEFLEGKIIFHFIGSRGDFYKHFPPKD